MSHLPKRAAVVVAVAVAVGVVALGSGAAEAWVAAQARRWAAAVSKAEVALVHLSAAVVLKAEVALAHHSVHRGSRAATLALWEGIRAAIPEAVGPTTVNITGIDTTDTNSPDHFSGSMVATTTIPTTPTTMIAIK
jgi:hypothetical protein